MIDENIARLRTYRNNISRYRRLLKTTLTDLDASSLSGVWQRNNWLLKPWCPVVLPCRSILNIRLLEKPPLLKKQK